jgi:hypothetical protein
VIDVGEGGERCGEKKEVVAMERRLFVAADLEARGEVDCEMDGGTLKTVKDRCGKWKSLQGW